LRSNFRQFAHVSVFDCIVDSTSFILLIYVAGKAWGNPAKSPVLALHGSLDNAATFDRLIPLLPQQFYYVCIDQPGCGISSHIAAGIPYHFIEFVSSVLRIIKHFKWRQVILMGHSYGGFVSAFFAAMYPELVTNVVMFDIIIPRMTAAHWTVHTLRFVHDKLIDSDKFETSPKPEYPYDVVFSKLQQGRATKINDEAATALLSRSVRKNGDKYSFCFDQRLKSMVHPIVSMAQLTEIYSKIQCPVLIVFAEDTIPSSKSSFVQEILTVLKYNSKYFQFTIVKGNHDVHLNNPEVVAPHVCKFLAAKCNL
jgi:pimeloyl-ACP methyl ester carboxylesterase